MSGVSLRRSAKHVLNICRVRGLRVATAESCTGGLVAAALTEIAGSSDVVDCGFVTYSNEAKQKMLGVPARVLQNPGAVSAETAVAITGIAGPGGGSKQKPVGLVYFAAASRNGRRLARARRFGKIGRTRIRLRSVAQALDMLAVLAQEVRG
jgi:nicotinamide-nucleotide amidase